MIVSDAKSSALHGAKLLFGMSTGWSRGIAVTVVLTTAMLVVAVPPAAAQGRAEATRLTDQAQKLIQENRLSEALQVLERATGVDPEYWEAHYQKGRTLGLLDRMSEALDALVRAAELNPGHAHTHHLAWLAAYKIGDYDTAWDQAIRASLAGIDMNAKFLEMFHASAPPEDFELRIRAPRVFVADVDAAEIEARSELPFNRNPMTGGFGTLTGRPDEMQGSDRFRESAADLLRVQRITRAALSRSPYFGVVLQAEQADYALQLSVDLLTDQAPRRMEGYLRLIDLSSGESAYYRTVEFRDIATATLLHGELERYVDDLEEWLRERSARR